MVWPVRACAELYIGLVSSLVTRALAGEFAARRNRPGSSLLGPWVTHQGFVARWHAKPSTKCALMGAIQYCARTERIDTARGSE
jgi:hypothetical protein